MTAETSKKGGVLSSLHGYCPSTKTVLHISTAVGGVAATVAAYTRWGSTEIMKGAAEAIKSGAEKAANHIVSKVALGAAAVSAAGYGACSLYQYCYPRSKSSIEEIYKGNPVDKQLESFAPNPTKTFHYNQGEEHVDYSTTGSKAHDGGKVDGEFDAHYKASLDGGAEHF
ncbi:MAG: hypothetical protein IRD7MM_05015 [Candidatus Midichloria mitochondrii]|nr:hypothetical protein [Candidatus Midichloria mitochondrii]MDJ1287696.1 hypothetical protein [Candidatus Midichloria mitochondrii]MDJ1298558.1 hypothetical protein [Candidatus Midichloria mitochondrii]MDJ1312684.1 hypothetical protein [Candidatus Midichloria mitochondrii]MDJ1583278.1 hypothetical protein [Candidatus Midichloria mitochondrii]